MASNFLIDGAKSFGQIASDSAKSAGGMLTDGINTAGGVFNTMIPPITLAKNFMGFEGTPETRSQQAWMKQTLLNKIRQSGNLTGGIDYSDYGSTTAKDPSGDWTGGMFGPEFAYGNTLGKADYSVPEGGGQVKWTGGAEYNFPKGTLGGPAGDLVANIVNSGGLSQMTGGEPLNYTPNINISKEEITKALLPSMNDTQLRQGQVLPKPPLSPVPPAYVPPKATPQQIKQTTQRDNQLQNKTPKPTGMMTSGPPRRSSRGSRRKAVAKPSRSNYSRKYSRLVGGR